MSDIAGLAVAQQQRLARLARAAADRAQERWARVDRSNITGSWAELIPGLVQVVTAAQLVAAAHAQEYLDLTVPDDAALALVPAAFAGATADGASLAGLFSLPPITAKYRIGQGLAVEDAMSSGLARLLLGVQTEVADASRSATQVGAAARSGVRGYVRVLSQPSCGRCLILAGRVYRWNQGFQRHPACDCIHASVGSADADMQASPRELFDAMTPDEQVAALGSKVNAEAVRLGADLGRVVNSQRGMYVAGERKLTAANARRFGVRGARPTPAQIFVDYPDRALAVEALRRFGYLTG